MATEVYDESKGNIYVAQIIPLLINDENLWDILADWQTNAIVSRIASGCT